MFISHRYKSESSLILVWLTGREGAKEWRSWDDRGYYRRL